MIGYMQHANKPNFKIAPNYASVYSWQKKVSMKKKNNFSPFSIIEEISIGPLIKTYNIKQVMMSLGTAQGSFKCMC